MYGQVNAKIALWTSIESESTLWSVEQASLLGIYADYAILCMPGA
jgi:hypothetical protein